MIFSPSQDQPHDYLAILQIMKSSELEKISHKFQKQTLKLIEKQLKIQVLRYNILLQQLDLTLFESS